MNGIQESRKSVSVQNVKARIGTRKGKFLICPICGKEFYRRPRDIKKVNHPTCSKKCSGELKRTTYKGSNNPKWRGGKIKRSDGRVFVYVPGHPKAIMGGSHILEYRLIAEIIIGRHLKDNEVVHHRDGDVTNNILDNLEVITFSEHARIHSANRQRSVITGRFL